MTVDNLTSRRSQLSAAKRALLEKRLKGNAPTDAAHTIPRRAERDRAPLSFAQARLWFVEQLQPGGFAYNIPTAVRLTGRLDVEALTRSLNEITRRHEALRTTFAAEGGRAVQLIAPELTLTLHATDLTGLSEAEREREAVRLATEEARTPFDLVTGPLVRARLLRLDEEEHVLLFTMHHIISDGWSMGVLVREVAALYGAFAEGRPSPLAELPVQYADFAAWQREWLQGETLAEQLGYWKQKLGGELPILELPTDRPRPAAQTFRGAALQFSLPSGLSERLKELARAEGATLYMTLLAAFKVLLARYTGQEEILTGTPIANRTREEVEGLIGFFVNTLVLRTDLSGRPTFRELLGRVRDTTLGAYAHQDLPFERVVEELQPERDPSRNPLFQVMFALQNAPMQSLELPGLTLRAQEFESAATRFDLEAHLWDLPEGLGGVLVYNTDLFDESTARRIARHYGALLEEAAQDPDRRVTDYSMLDEAERQRLLVEWNDTAREYPRDSSIAELFERQAAATPDATALVFHDAQMTYAELNRRANRLARHLRGCGVGPDTLVGVLLERSAELVTGLLAILKAGGAYVPLDPDYPRARLEFMAEDAGLKVLLTEESLRGLLAPRGCEVVCVDADRPVIANESDENLPSAVTGDNLAAVIYTSGSTGRPKGILIPHHAVNSLVLNTDYVRLSADDRVTQASNVSFDAAIFEIWGALLNGARLVGVTKEVALAPHALVRHLREQGVNTLFLTTSLFNRMALEVPGAFGALEHVLLGGEAADPRRFEEVLRAGGPRRLINAYGPTESTTFATWQLVREVAPGATNVPIGRPVANTTAYVLDAGMRPVPVGVAGELYLGGDGLARGYLNRPALTAERFIPDPFSTRPGTRLYRTGDLARRFEGGELEFLGRVDQQVKVRGFRIEPGEIEAALAEHPGVRDCVVIARADKADDRRLVAYVVARQDATDAGGQTAEHVGQWQALYDDLYSHVSAESEGPSFNVTGWNSSYTGEPIPAEEMREWQAATVERILSLRPRRVLEIGCGTGLLLLRLAPACEAYVGMDFSQVSLDYVRRQLEEVGGSLPHVELLKRTAEDFDGFEPESFDTVILNSVVQYFPGLDYLLRVLEGAMRVTRPGGSIFLGDLRNLRLLEAFHASVALFGADDATPTAALAEGAFRGAAEEDELLLAPELFDALKSRLPALGRVEVRLKQGRAHNELTRFRYDVTLHVGADAEETDDCLRLDWMRERLTLDSLRQRLSETHPRLAHVTRVPNARVFADVRAAQLLASEEKPASAGALRALLDESDVEGIDPQDVWELGDVEPYVFDVRWSGEDNGASFDILVRRRGDGEPRGGDVVPLEVDGARAADALPLRAYANDPLRSALARRLVPALRDFARERLPEYMVPSAFVVLDSLPLTPNGKVDRRALPAPEQTRAQLAGDYVAPRDAVEETLARIWTELLGVARVGARDDFFDLGGHSLLATQLMSRVRDAFGVELSLRGFFAAPTVEELARAVGAAKGTDTAPPPLVRRARGGAAPLSFAQQRLWFLDQLETAGAAYHIPAIFRIEGRLDAGALERALTEIVRRHEALRTIFREANGEAVQVVRPPDRISLPSIDLAGLPPDEREREAVRLATVEAQSPFDLSEGPLIRARLLRLGPEEQVLMLTMHHIVSDGWSLGVLSREFAALYAAYTRGESSPLAELPIQYADYAAWQRGWLGGEALEAQLAYWRGRLAGAPAALELPTDRPRPAAQSFRGAHIEVALPAELTVRLRDLSKSAGTTLFMTLLAGFQALLARYTGQRDIVVGTPIANRTRSELEQLIGFFVNTLALRTDLSGEPTFAELVSRVREVTLGAYAHQDVPFERLVEELQPERDLSRNPLFQVMFALQNAPMQSLELPGLTLKPQEFDAGSTRFDLECHLWEVGEGLRGFIAYSTDLFDEATMRRLAGHFQTLLEAAAAAPGARVTSLPLLKADERQQQLVEWNDTKTGFDARDLCVHQIFSEQAALTPRAVAVSFDGRVLTYAELDRRANQLARHLRALGVGPDVVVGICVERSVEMVVGVLGVLKAGGAYLPLDPEYPTERLRLMLDDARARVLLTNESLKALLPHEGARVLLLDADWPEVERQDDSELDAQVSPENLAYVIYTSGSTGRPKGVAMPHGPLTNLIRWQMERTGASSRPRTLQFASLSFDASFQELFSTWCVGATLVLIDEARRRDAGELLRVLRDEEVERLFLPFVALQSLAEASELEGIVPAHLREVITAGEQLKATRHVRSLFDRLGRAVLDNQYGPSECHVVSAYALEGDPGTWPELPPIGRPISNTRLYVLDTRLEPVPIGVSGELYIGGGCLARGYLNRPDATAEKFVPDPFSAEPGARLYRTGDLARFLPDGHIDFLGRIDHQVKIRGFRVELGEIEAALREHAAVRDCVVTAREDGPGGKRLVAYVLPDAADEATAARLRPHLEERLPAYMVPSAFVMLEELPLTPSGKVDRKRLPAPGAAPADADAYLAPRTPTEELLAGFWVEVLGVERAGVRDNFFDLGGHSLLATQLMSRVRQALRVELPLRLLFERPTVEGLARAVEAHAGAGEQPPRETLGRAPRENDAAPVSFAQQRLWFLDQLRPGSNDYNLPAALRLKGALDVEALTRSVNEIVRRHESLRTTFRSVEGEPAQVVAPFLPAELPLTDLSHLPEQEREAEALRLAQEEAAHPFDLERGPLVRAALVRLADAEHLLLFTMHHIVSDGWSLGVLVRELTTLYEAFVKGEPSPLEELPVQYADYAVWQREWLQGETLEAQLSYWRRQLEGAPPSLELPTDFPRPDTQITAGAAETLVLPAELVGSLKALGRREGATLYMTLLAAFQSLLARYTGQRDILVGSPIAGRNDARLEELIGFFVNTLVLRTNFAGDPTFRELLSRVREVTLDAYAHQDVPFERLVEELQPERSLNRTPLFQVMFALQNAPQGELRLPGLTLEPLTVESDSTKFDLSFSATESGGQLFCVLHYKTALFEAATAARMLAHFEILLRAAAADPDERAAALPYLTAEEKRLLLEGWNETARDYPREDCVHELFERQAARTPDAIAVRFEDEGLTYAELDAAAEQLARRLRALGVGPETFVGLLTQRTPRMLVGLLAVLKAGGAYVPLDPSWPRERLALMLDDARVPVLLAEERLAASLPETDARFVLLDAVEAVDEGHGQSEGVRAWRARPENPAYVIYTSGSTGRPKGVVVEHQQIVNYVRAIVERAGFEPGMSFAMVQPLTVDSSQTVIFPALFVGGTLHLVSRERAADAAALGEYFERNPVDCLKIAPSHLAALQTAAWPERLMPRRRLVIGGEASRREWAEGLAQLVPGCTVFNHYGPTEATVGMLTYSLDAGASRRPTRVLPMGRPLANAKAYVLDRNMRPVAVGVSGELYIGGLCVARGYLHRPGVTAERFIPDPFSQEPGARLYKTGDVVSRLPDGDLLFIGRDDHQVKIRGFRIELGEIESALRRHARVRDCVVLAREEATGDRRLVGYVVPAEAERAEGLREELREYLREKLPDYMVPSALILLEALPLSAHGKLDVQRLPAPEALTAQSEGYVAPRNEAERQLASIWEELLGARPVGVRDNFFELGGHSLLATRMMAQVQKRTGRRLPLVALFEGATVESLARALARDGREQSESPLTSDSSESPLVAIQPTGTRPPLFCVHEVGGGVMEYAHLARHLGPDQPFYGLRATGAARSIEEMAATYVAALRAARPQGPYVLGGWSFGGLVAFEMAQRLRGLGAEVTHVFLFDSIAPGYIEQAKQDEDALHYSTNGDEPAALARDVWRLSRQKPPEAFEGLEALAPDERAARLFAHARQLGVVPEEFEHSDFVRWLKGYRDRLLAARTYVPRPYDGRVTLFKAAEISDEDRRKFHPRLSEDPSYGWGGLARGRFDLLEVPGSHLTLMFEPHVRALAAEMQRRLTSD